MDSSQEALYINDFLSDAGCYLMGYMSDVVDFQYQYVFLVKNTKTIWNGNSRGT